MAYYNNPYYGYYPQMQPMMVQQPMVYPQQQVAEQPQNLNVQFGQTTSPMDSQDDMGKKEKLDTKDVELIDKFVDIIKDIDEIGMSQDMGYSHMNGGSYRSSRMMPMYGRSYRSSYGREGNGYSRTSNREEVMDYLRDAMDMAEDEKDRKAINRLMTQMSER